MITRRHAILGAGTALLAGQLAFRPAWGRTFEDVMAEIEKSTGGRLGVGLLDLQTDKTAFHRGDERFPMCSTFKFLLAAAVLAKADAREENLARRVRFEKAELLPHSPMTEQRAGDAAGLTIAQLCEAAVTQSDNTAANLLLASLDGPTGLTAFARKIGDTITRLDRTEPDLNDVAPGDERDTTSPRAMAEDMRKILVGDVLKIGSREQLSTWMRESATGKNRIRASLPMGWSAGDKTGTGPRGTSNDIAIMSPSGRQPIILTVYLTGATVDQTKQEAAIATVATAVIAALGLS
ncbi:beta-lactamase OXY-1 precursor [Variibacter gotjawalensis]|uniref:Beta-lactamase n=1 Tax=Variibacter gotjawalensis TaxID=1333996 RepID=A0A0S3PS60_9BRAD|nr:class A beta-lactamase [Variibacter gotjawalensis]NIK49099.1 beta-lactamase class A [Variibacter gotjawalensis]RZS50955.1 beta-lactamase class A [Variibacter gotjawalensis]BAT58789.1 beta-lactamase OXY-1 precursor [Variibacter gotjawalensis]